MLSWGRSSSREGRPSSEERSPSSKAGGDVATRHAVRQRMDAIAGEDDDIGAWNDGSEDEQEVVKTVKGLSKLDVNVSSPSSTGATEQQRTARPATQQRSSSWSFNPFSIISGSPKTPVAAETSTAAALEQAAKRATARRQDSSSSSIPSTKHAPRASTSKLIVEELAPRKASVEMRELWRAAIRQDVDDIVRGTWSSCSAWHREAYNPCCRPCYASITLLSRRHSDSTADLRKQEVVHLFPRHI